MARHGVPSLFHDKLIRQKKACTWFQVWNLHLVAVPRDLSIFCPKSCWCRVKEAIIRVRNQNKPLRQMAETLRVAKSTIWFSSKQREGTGRLSNTKPPGRPLNTTEVDGGRDSPIGKQNFFTWTGRFRGGSHCLQVYNQERPSWK